MIRPESGFAPDFPGQGAPAPGHGSQAPRSGCRGAVSALAVVIALSLSCGDSSTEPTPGAPPVTGSITGQVSIEGTGIDGVSINLSNGNATTTSGGGNYRFDNIAGGAYTVTISGYPSDATFDATSAATTISSAGQSVTVNFTGSYIRSASIMGTVSVENVGLAGVMVRLSGMADAQTTTDNNGQYAFTSLRAGNYSVEISRFDSDKVAFEFTSSSAAVGVGEATIVSFDGIYLRTAGIQGHVKVEGEGFAGVTVSLTGGPDNVSETTMTDASGQFAFVKLRAGDYTVAISGQDMDAYLFDAPSKNVTLGDDESVIVNFEGMFARTASISGMLFVDEAPKNGMYDEGEDALAVASVPVVLAGPSVSDQTETVTNEKGQFAFTSLRTGVYVLQLLITPEIRTRLGLLGDYAYSGPSSGYSIELDVGEAHTQDIPFDITIKPLSGLTITTSGAIRIGGITNLGCISSPVEINGVRYVVHWMEWQRRTAGSAWTQVAGTRRNGMLCGYSLANAQAGEYRFVGEMTVNGVRGRYRSENTVTVDGSSNQSPATVATIPDQTLVVRGGATTMRVAAAFTDPDGDALSYSATSDDDNVATVGASGSILRINPVAEGTTTVSVTATDADGLSASVSFGITVERLPSRHHNVILRVVHVTTDWMPYVGGTAWIRVAEPKESASLKYFEAAIWDETASVHLYEFDNDFDPPFGDSARTAYREQHAVRKHTGMPRQYGARQNFVKAAFADFARYIADRFPDSDHHLLYSGHGGPGGRLFGGMLSREGAAEFLGTWREALGRRLGVIDMGGPCNKGGLSDLETFCQHARYYVASDLPNGGYDMDNWTSEKWDEVKVERQYHSLFARHRDLEDALVGRIDLKRKRYEYSRGDMTANKVEQANYLYSCANMMSEFGWNAQLFVEQSGGTYGYGIDLLQYLTDNEAPESLLEMFDHTIIHQADNRDFFAWEEVANGIMLCCEY